MVVLLFAIAVDALPPLKRAPSVPNRPWHAGYDALLFAHDAPTRNCGLAVRRGCASSPTPIAETSIEPLRSARQSPSSMSPNTSRGHLKQYEITNLWPRTSLRSAPLPATDCAGCNAARRWSQRS